MASRSGYLGSRRGCCSACWSFTPARCCRWTTWPSVCGRTRICGRRPRCGCTCRACAARWPRSVRLRRRWLRADRDTYFASAPRSRGRSNDSNGSAARDGGNCVVVKATAASEHVATERSDLWRGHVLKDLGLSAACRAGDRPPGRGRLDALEDRIEADLMCGADRELVAELERLVNEHPLRERLWGERIVALYRSGRQVEALRTLPGSTRPARRAARHLPEPGATAAGTSRSRTGSGLWRSGQLVGSRHGNDSTREGPSCESLG